MEIITIQQVNQNKTVPELPTLLYGSEYWKITENDSNKLSVFHTKKLKKKPAHFLAQQDF